MGAENRCRVRFGKQSGQGRALLETNELIFRGDFRLVIPFKDISKVNAVDGELRVRFSGGEAVFELGPLAEKWAAKILHPKSTIEKLGVKPGMCVTLAGSAGCGIRKGSAWNFEMFETAGTQM